MEMFKTFKKKYGKDASVDKRAVQKMRREVERAKRTLSTAHQARVEIESLYDGIYFAEVLTRSSTWTCSGRRSSRWSRCWRTRG
jgi:heat shock protein 5